MSEPDDFVAKAVSLHVTALNAAHNGDPKPYVEEWSTRDPLTVFGARSSVTGGWEAVSQAIRALVSRFTNGTPGKFEVVAADVGSDLAYLVGFERSMVSVDGGPMEPVTLRVTHIYRRENGDWRLIHRHADNSPQ
jgi:ketosteroid isomerase-like protein